MERDPAHPLLRGGIGKAPGHELFEGLRDFIEGVDIGVESEVIGSVRAGLHLRRVEERQKRRLPGLPISDDYDVRLPQPLIAVSVACDVFHTISITRHACLHNGESFVVANAISAARSTEIGVV